VTSLTYGTGKNDVPGIGPEGQVIEMVDGNGAKVNSGQAVNFGGLSSGDHADANLERPWGAATYHAVIGGRAVIDMIVQGFQSSGRDAYAADTLIFPLGFQCRHLVELRLKELYELLAHRPAEKTHELLALWQRVRPLIEARWPGSNRSTGDLFGHLPREILEELGIVLRTEGILDRAEALIAALDAIDPRGLSFRYPDTIPSHVTRLSLERLAETAIELDDFLDGCATGVNEERSIRAEMAHESRADLEAEA